MLEAETKHCGSSDGLLMCHHLLVMSAQVGGMRGREADPVELVFSTRTLQSLCLLCKRGNRDAEGKDSLVIYCHWFGLGATPSQAQALLLALRSGISPGGAQEIRDLTRDLTWISRM